MQCHCRNWITNHAWLPQPRVDVRHNRLQYDWAPSMFTTVRAANEAGERVDLKDQRKGKVTWLRKSEVTNLAVMHHV
jgi:hypothetical protein